MVPGGLHPSFRLCFRHETESSGRLKADRKRRCIRVSRTLKHPDERGFPVPYSPQHPEPYHTNLPFVKRFKRENKKNLLLSSFTIIKNETRAYPGFLSHTEEGCETQPRDELTVSRLF